MPYKISRKFFGSPLGKKSDEVHIEALPSDV